MTAPQFCYQGNGMKKILFAFGALLLTATAQAQTTPFKTFLETSPAASGLAGGDLSYLDQSSVSKKVTLTQLTTFVNANGAPNLAAATGTLPAGSFPALTGVIT